MLHRNYNRKGFCSSIHLGGLPPILPLHSCQMEYIWHIVHSYFLCFIIIAFKRQLLFVI